MDLRLVVAVVETGTGGSGKGSVTLTCRPAAVDKLKQRRGSLVMKNVSASQFVQNECSAVGVPCVVQTSAKRASISRDVYVVGQTDKNSSSWTTFERLAGEEGYELFEVTGTVYFGRFDHFIKVNPKFEVLWSTAPEDQSSPLLAEAAPQCRTSIDSDTDDRSVTVHVPIQRAADVRAGYVLLLSGVPGFDGSYIITDVTYDLLGQSDVQIDAVVPVDPAPTSTNKSTTASSTSSASSGNAHDPQIPSGWHIVNTEQNPVAVKGTKVKAI
jgi:hypothetical protein